MARSPEPNRQTKCALNLESLEDRSVPATLSGYAFFDTNTNGVQDAGEAAAAGVGVTASPSSGAPVGATTDGSGYFALTLSPGSYAVSYTAPIGYAAAGTTVVIAGDTDAIGIGGGFVGAGSGSASASATGSSSGSASGSASGSGSA
ncbi:MAG: hypothetical protein J0I06_18360, partial [Planctomycetes bacterium]|nr:hypothetical protein [Planctomycetota bacterium]